MVGGAVLNQEYADMIGADFYGKDAMQSVHYAEKIFKDALQKSADKKNKYLSEKEYSVDDNDFVNRYI